jgi:hypothetical protein
LIESHGRQTSSTGALVAIAALGWMMYLVPPVAIRLFVSYIAGASALAPGAAVAPGLRRERAAMEEAGQRRGDERGA